MKKILFTLALLFAFVSFGQTPIDAYKYASVLVMEYDDGFEDIHGLSKTIKELFKELRIITIDDNQMQDFMSRKNPCELLTVSYLSHIPKGKWRTTVTIEIQNCLGQVVFSESATAGSDMTGQSRDIRTAASRIFSRAFDDYKFNAALTPKLPAGLKADPP